MEKSQSVQNIGKALSTFHVKMNPIKKDATNPYFKNKYATLGAILEAIKIPLAESGLAFSQMPDGNCITTILIHAESGEYLQSCYDIHPVKVDPQGIGSAITYARRYALSSILGLSVDDDDDGNEATKPANGQAKQPHTPGKIEPNTVATADTRKWLSEAQFNTAIERINGGEADLYEKLDKEFRMKKDYRDALLACSKLSHALNQ